MDTKGREMNSSHSEEQTDPSAGAETERPVFIWVLSILILLYAIVALIAGVVTGRVLQAPALVIVLLAMGGFGVGLWVGMRWVLTVLRVVWVLFSIILVLSFLAASSIGGPNWGHGVGLLFLLLLIPLWFDSVKAFCSKTDEDLG